MDEFYLNHLKLLSNLMALNQKSDLDSEIQKILIQLKIMDIWFNVYKSFKFLYNMSQSGIPYRGIINAENPNSHIQNSSNNQPPQRSLQEILDEN